MDCKYYIGEKPCVFGNDCPSCLSYYPIQKRILIIKLAALGDVLRTTAILKGLRKRYPASEIVWITRPNAQPLLKLVAGVDKVYSLSEESILTLSTERFDFVYNFDKEEVALSLAVQVSAGRKFGFSKNLFGRLDIFNSSSQYAQRLGVDDQLKFHNNTKSYVEIIYEMAELPYYGEKYDLTVPHKNLFTIQRLLEKHNVFENDFVVGINTGAGDKFQTKLYSPHAMVELCKIILEKTSAKVLLIGGEKEERYNQQLARQIASQRVVAPPSLAIPDFCALVQRCNILVSADSFAMHVGVAVGTYVVAFFGPTVASEVSFFGKGEKIIATAPCAPCYLQKCKWPVSCIQAIPPQRIWQAVEKGMGEPTLRKSKSQR